MRTNLSKYALIFILPISIVVIFITKKIFTNNTTFFADRTYQEVSIDLSTNNLYVATIDSFMYILLVIGIGFGFFYKNKLND